MNELNLDPTMAAVIAYVREVHDPIRRAFAAREHVDEKDLAALSGSVHALLRAIDARLPKAAA